MITTLDISVILFKRLNESLVLKSSLSGGIFRDARPANSPKEDVVVNVVTSDTGSAQRGVANVNIHVPSIVTGTGMQPNHLRIKALTDIVTPLLKDVYNASNNYWIDQMSLIKEPNADQWFFNYRIRFKYHNSN